MSYKLLMYKDLKKFVYQPKRRSSDIESFDRGGMSIIVKRRLESDSSDEDSLKQKKSKSFSNHLKNANSFFSENSGSDEEAFKEHTVEPSDEEKLSNDGKHVNASPILLKKKTKHRRFRFVSEDSNEEDSINEKSKTDVSVTSDHFYAIKSNSMHQLSSSSDEDSTPSNSSRHIAQKQKKVMKQSKNYIIPISRQRLAGPRSSADVMKQSISTSFKAKPTHDFDIEDDSAANDESYQKQQDFDSDLSVSSDDDDCKTLSENMKKKILNLLQESPEEELATVPKCSTKKAKVLISLRPFASWDDLLIKLDDTKLLNRDLVWSCIDLIHERHTLCTLMHKCSQISKKLEAELSKMCDLGTKSPKRHGNDLVIQQQPDNINSNFLLKPYQMIGLNWIALLHRNNVSGILADEMGLGKTIQTISFIAYLQSVGISYGPHLIVVPSSTMDNWIREFTTWCPSLKLIVYNGSQTERKSIRHQLLHSRSYTECNVILTTYNLAISAAEDRMLFRKLGVYYAVFDEGHMLKNMSSQRFQYLMRITAQHRLLLTGTPLQNNLLELMSLLRFVMPHMFEETTTSLVRIFTHSNSDNSSSFAQQRIKHAKKIMQPFVLRRLKSDVLNQLPEKIENICHCDMTTPQQALYDSVKAKFKNKFTKQNLPSSELRNVFVELRKVANHPLLRREHYSDSKLRTMAKLLKQDVVYSESNEIYLFEDMQVMNDFELHNLSLTSNFIKSFKLTENILLGSGKFQKLTELLPKLKRDGKRILIFSQFTLMMDIIEVYLKLHNHTFLRLDGQTPVGQRLDLIDKFNNDDSIFVFLLSTKAGGLGINLTSASVVILHDIDCNPYNDKQAEDRCHRLGQTKTVEVIKLISKNTIEEKMYLCAQYKLGLEKEMTGGDDSTVDMATLITQSLE